MPPPPGLFDGTPLQRPVTCERCGKAKADCRCAKDNSGQTIDPRSQSPRVRREKRRGKWSTVIAEHGLCNDDAKALLKDLRTALGTGGGLGDTHPNGVEIILQGDHRDTVLARLIQLGYKAKPAGG